RNYASASNISTHANHDSLLRIPQLNLSRTLTRHRINDLFRRNPAPTLLQRNPECLINTHLSRAPDNRCANTRNVTRNHLFHRFHLENVSELPRPILENRPELRDYLHRIERRLGDCKSTHERKVSLRKTVAKLLQ